MALLLKVFQVVVQAYALAAAIVPHVEDLVGPGSGPVKREAAVDRITKQLGADLPSWLDATLAHVVGLAVDWAVKRFNEAQGPGKPEAAA